MTSDESSQSSQPAQVLQQAIDPMNKHDSEFMAQFDAMYDTVWGEGAIPAKYKELAGVAMSITIRCESCLAYHIRMAVEAGATKAELVEMVRLAILSGGSGGIPTARYGYTVIEGLLEA